MKLVKIETHLERLLVDVNPFHYDGHVCIEIPASLWDLDFATCYVVVFTNCEPHSMQDVYEFRGHGDSIEILDPTDAYLKYTGMETGGKKTTYMTNNARNRLWGKRDSYGSKNVPTKGYVWCEEA